mmetsp:Transcript_14385/g.28954  ORF Transcript_14385/g.28954 Transcript_14385/m.28954 type:complete len:111 (-) Transcript_14385:611-943(-)
MLQTDQTDRQQDRQTRQTETDEARQTGVERDREEKRERMCSVMAPCKTLRLNSQPASLSLLAKFEREHHHSLLLCIVSPPKPHSLFLAGREERERDRETLLLFGTQEDNR